MASSLSSEFYARGLSLYQTGGTLRSMTEHMDSFRDAADADHKVVETTPDADGVMADARRTAHQNIDERYRGAEQSFTLGFADGALADLRLIAARQRGQRA